MIYLHIGRNKAGSTTLQDFFVANCAALERHGIRYALYGHLKGSIPGMLGFDRQDEIAAYAQAHPERSLLISHEWMLQWDAIHVEIMAAALQGLPVKVIAYIRPYPSWISSNYAQDIRIGESSKNFDAYFESFRPLLSIWPGLKRWGELFGWNNIIVRLIDRQNTSWDHLAGDFLSAIGLDPDLGVAVPASNQGPHWMVTELLRALAALRITKAETEALQNLLQKTLQENSQSSGVQYLTQAQAQEVAEIYGRDIANINAHTGAGIIPEPLAISQDRPFLPSFSSAPEAVLRDFAVRTQAPGFALAQPEAAVAAQRIIPLYAPLSPRQSSITGKIRRLWNRR